MDALTPSHEVRLRQRQGAGQRRKVATPALKLRIIQPGHEDRIVTVPGPEALIGRAGNCDIVIPDRHISGRHARLLTGPVIVDLESTNGTFVGGARVREACPFGGSVVHLGSEEGDIRIELLDDSSDELDVTLERPLREVLPKQERRTPKTVTNLSHDTGSQAELRRERDELAQVVANLTADLGRRELELSEAIGARRRLDGQLEQERKRISDLETERAEMQANVELLRAQLEEAKIPPPTDDAELLRVLHPLVSQDCGQPANPDWAPARFLAYEVIRFMHRVDRIAEGPVRPGNLGVILSELLGKPNITAPRRKLLAYMDDLVRELEIAVRAYPAATARFVEELKDELSMRGLTRTHSIPAFKQLSGQVDGELWLRASKYLENITTDSAQKRIRDLAQQLWAPPGTPPAPGSPQADP